MPWFQVENPQGGTQPELIASACRILRAGIDRIARHRLVGVLDYLQATEKLGFYGRAEYLRDRGDQKLFKKTVLLDPTDPDTAVVVSSAPDRVLELTATAQYDPWKNVLSRVEIRWDHSLSGEGVWGSTDPATGTGSLRNEVMIAGNIIYKF